MGAIFGGESKIELMASVSRLSEGYRLIKQSLRGDNLWQLIEEIETGNKTINVCLIKYNAEHGYGYKGIPEDCGPRETNCPISFIRDASPTDNKYALKWRQAVIDNYMLSRKNNSITN
jgi:hypothetical protein